MRTKAGIILLGQGEGIMKTKARVILLGLVMAIAFCYATSVRAETSFATGVAAQSGGTGAAVNLDFQIIIPEFIYFRVGSDLAVIDQILFSPTPAQVANAILGIAGTGGDLLGGTVTVSLVSNSGGVDITETNNSGGSGLGDGTGNFISYGQINTATTDGNLPAPALSNSNLNSVSITPTSGAITNRQAQWTYTYDNPATPPAAGTYGGSANGGQVTYTAAVP